MTVQEAKEFIQGKIDCMDRCDVFDCKHTDECENCNYCYSQGNFGEQKNALKFAIESMEEVEQYRALGTVEELKEAREKQPKTDWIPCEERLPIGEEYRKKFDDEWYYKEVLATTSEGYMYVGFYYPEDECWYDNNGFVFFPIAWQPIQPYKKEGAE